MPSRNSTSRSANRPPSEDMCGLSKRATIDLPQMGDRPGNIGVDSAVAGMVAPDAARFGFDTRILHQISGLYHARQP